MVQNNNLNRIRKAKDRFKNGISLNTNKSLVLFILSLFIFSSCEKNEMDNNDVLYPKGSKLKQISHVESINSEKGGMIIAQYEYDERGRISKVSLPVYENGTVVGLYSYSDYIYNNDSQLEKIIYFHSNLYEGFINSETRTYSYDKDGNKLKEVIEYPRSSPFRTDYNLYYYDNNRLKQEDKYYDGYHGNETWSNKLTTYIEYEYDNQGNLVKETSYSATDDTPYQFSVHSYQNELNIKTQIYNCYNGKTEQIREINRYYDKNDNLIYLESKELSMYSSAISYVNMYEYY